MIAPEGAADEIERDDLREARSLRPPPGGEAPDPDSRMIDSTALCPTMMFRPYRSSAVTRSAPYVPPEALCTSAISPASQIRLSVLGGSGRPFDA